MYFQFIAAVAAISTIVSTGNGLTPEEAQSLSLSELAAKVLGQAGNIMVDVQRPQWIGPFAGPGAPPVRYISFYQRARSADFGERWRGLCQSHVATVFFDSAGSPRFMETHDVYGVSPSLQRIETASGSRSLDEAEKDCANLTSKEKLFHARSLDQARDVAVALSSITRAQIVRHKWPFSYLCKDQFAQDCHVSRDPISVAESYLSSGKWEVESAPCRPMQHDSSDKVATDCMTLTKVSGCMTAQHLEITYQKKKEEVVVRRVNLSVNRIAC